jgi:hypothetical protein
MNVVIRIYEGKGKRGKLTRREIECTCIDIETEAGTFYIDELAPGILNIGSDGTVSASEGKDETLNIATN